MNIVNHAKFRYSTKSFDPNKKIPQEQVQALKDVLQLSPSSLNLQPWHFILATSDKGKKEVAKATQGDFVFNEAKILNASHVIVLCSLLDSDAHYLQRLTEQEEIDGRLDSDKTKAIIQNARKLFTSIHRDQLNDVSIWLEKQVYLNLGTLLLSAASMGIDAVPMEGFDANIMDETFALRQKGYTAVAIVALGYRSDDDFNAKLPKSRFSQVQLFTEC